MQRRFSTHLTCMKPYSLRISRATNNRQTKPSKKAIKKRKRRNTIFRKMKIITESNKRLLKLSAKKRNLKFKIRVQEARLLKPLKRICKCQQLKLIISLKWASPRTLASRMTN